MVDVSSFLHHVSNVIRWGPYKEVIRIAALGVVTLVADTHPFRDRPNEVEIGYSVCPFGCVS